ncbi:unnamed protein product, partial [Pylaiella littoralis]
PIVVGEPRGRRRGVPSRRSEAVGLQVVLRCLFPELLEELERLQFRRPSSPSSRRRRSGLRPGLDADDPPLRPPTRSLSRRLSSCATRDALGRPSHPVLGTRI